MGTAWAGSLDDEAIVTALREARDNATFATEDEFVAFARPDGVARVDPTRQRDHEHRVAQLGQHVDPQHDLNRTGRVLRHRRRERNDRVPVGCGP